MLALCSMLSGTYYAHNYASIIGGSLGSTSHGTSQQSTQPFFFTLMDIVLLLLLLLIMDTHNTKIQKYA